MTGAPDYFSKDLLKGKVAIVTGGGSGIGRVISLELARHGAIVAAAARKLDRLEAVADEIKAAGGEALAVAADVSDHEQVEAMVETVVSKFGRVDIMVNNAAANFIWPSEKLTAVRWRKVIDIVLNGTFNCSLEAGKRMLEQGGGSIINIVACYAWTGGPGFLASASAKGGVVAMTRTLGVEWARRGVRVNAIAPGVIDTPQTRERLWPTEEIVKKMLDGVPVGRFGVEQDVSNLVLYLSSPMASYITGEVVVADGGQNLGKGAMEMLGSLAIAKRARVKS
jgi:NAD(P)-dependent dehydrogenase (short-subunit alcohol dehydrogenase family)